METKVFVRCLESDKDIIESLLEDCKSEFQREVKEQHGEDVEIEVEVDTNNFMIERRVQDFSDVELKDMGEQQEALIKIPKHEDDKKW